MKFLVLACVLAFSGGAFAMAGSRYHCGPYDVEFDGPDLTILTYKDVVLGRWEKEGTDPTTVVKNQIFLRWGRRMYLCHEIDEAS